MRNILLAILVVFFLSSTASAGDMEDYQRYKDARWDNYPIDFSAYKLKDYPGNWVLTEDRSYDVGHNLSVTMQDVPYGQHGRMLEEFYCVGGLKQKFNVPYPAGLVKYNILFFPNAGLAHKFYKELERIMDAMEKEVDSALRGNIDTTMSENLKLEFRKEKVSKEEGYKYKIYNKGVPRRTIYLFREGERVYFIVTPAEAEEYFSKIAPVNVEVSSPSRPSLPKDPTARIIRFILAGVVTALGLSILGAIAILIKNIFLVKSVPAALPKISIKIPSVKPGPKIKISKPQKPLEVKETQEKIEKREEKEKKPVLAEIALHAQPPEVTADGRSKSQIKIFAADSARHPACGEAIELWFENYDGSKIEPSQVVTDADGEAKAAFTAGKIKGEQKLSAQAKSNTDIKAFVKIKLREEVYYEAGDKRSGFKIRVNIPRKGINSVKLQDILGARVLDNFDNDVREGYSTGLIDLAALIGHYGISDKLTYTKEARRWENLFAKCSRIAGELESAMGIGLGVGIMTFTGALALIIAEEFGGKLISTSAKVLGKAQDKAESKIGLEKQDQVYNLIQRERDYMTQMSKAAEELAELWSQIDNEGGDPYSAVKLIKCDLELEFYKLNNKILTVAVQKAKITDSFSQSDFDAVNKDIENINKTILELNHKIHQMQVLRERIRSFVISG